MPWRKAMDESQSGRKIVFAILCVILLLVLFNRRDDSGEKSDSRMNATVESLEYKLASIDAGRRIKEGDTAVIRFRTLLDLLSEKYTESRQQIADMSVAAQNSLKESGIDESILNTMEGMNELFGSNLGNQKYAEYSAAYITLRKSGLSHRDAIEDLKALLQKIGVD